MHRERRPRPPVLQLIPESAPFSAEQRTWLNDFFAGLASLDGAVTPLSLAESAALMSAPPAAVDIDDGAPWHDQTLPLAERMKLAEGRPLRRRMMAAMAQQDCGQCGYNCQDYSDALFSKQGGASESLRARREGNRPHAQDALRGARPFLGDHNERDDHGSRKCYGCAGRGARPLAR